MINDIDYRHSIATYPSAFAGVAISQNRMCLQFYDVNAKLRKNLRAENMDLIKRPDTLMALPLDGIGYDIHTLAVRTTPELSLEVLDGIVDAHLRYYETVDQDMTNIQRIKEVLENLLDRVKTYE